MKIFHHLHTLCRAQSGRSMIEMLGVLTIIGVLSLMAIAGYSWAMNKNRANDIWSGVSKAQLTLETAMNSHSSVFSMDSATFALTPQSQGTFRTGYGLDMYDPDGVVCTNDTYDILLRRVSSKVCRILLSEKNPVATLDVRKKSNQNEETLCLELRELGSDCGEDEEVNIIFTFAHASDVGETAEPCEGSDCEDRGNCTSGQFRGRDNVCRPCSDPAIVKSTRIFCDACGMDRKYTRRGDCILTDRECDGFLNNSGVCYPCDYSGSVAISQSAELEAGCRACGRGIRRLGGVLTTCVPVCENGTFQSLATCQPCDYIFAEPAEEKDCLKCKNREMRDGQCVIKECAGWNLRTPEGYCVPCDSEYVIHRAAGEDCGPCEGRIMYGEYCAIANCDGFRSQEGNCFACDLSANVSVGSDTSCTDVCGSKRILVDGLCKLSEEGCDGVYATSGHCYTCDYETAVTVGTAGSCGTCSNREKIEDKCYTKCPSGIRDVNGICRDCHYPSVIVIPAGANCNACLGIRHKPGNNSCILTECNNLRDSVLGSCYACEYEYTVNVGATGACEIPCPNRVKFGVSCAIACKNGEYMDSGGRCHACTDAETLASTSVTAAECQKCGDVRFWDGAYCSLQTNDWEI